MHFETTSWSVILEAARNDAAQRDALSHVLERYWPPVFAFIRASVPSREEAEDLTQGFFQRVIEGNYLEQADRTRGKFRSFLLGAVRHFLSDERDRVLTQKRGGGAIHVPIDTVTIEAAGTPEECFRQQWARATVKFALDQLRAAMEREGRLADFDRLSPFLTGDADRSMREAAEEAGMSEGAVRVAVHRLRGRFGDVLRRAIAETVAGPREVEEEIRFLIAALEGPS